MVEHYLAKVDVESSNLFARSILKPPVLLPGAFLCGEAVRKLGREFDVARRAKMDRPTGAAKRIFNPKLSRYAGLRFIKRFAPPFDVLFDVTVRDIAAHE